MRTTIQQIWSHPYFGSLFAPIFGNGAGAGMALLCVACAIAMFTIGAVGFRLPELHRLDETLSAFGSLHPLYVVIFYLFNENIYT